MRKPTGKENVDNSPGWHEYFHMILLQEFLTATHEDDISTSKKGEKVDKTGGYVCTAAAT